MVLMHTGGGNLSYSLPAGGGLFGVDTHTGVVHTLALLDREAQAQHEFVVFVTDGQNQADSCLVLVWLLDANDQSPEFDDSCRGLSVPENGPPEVHAMVAWDRDEGSNARLLYSIAAGNVGDKFRLEPRTGRLLTSTPLDRESVSEYRLTVLATDQGSPARTGSCTLVVTVVDENDEPPRFEQAVYSASVAEDAAPNTTVLAVRAHDPDLGLGGRVSYSLANETAALFRIDSDTGVLTTTGLFDREKRASYTFEVLASDNGRYQAHWAHARVQVTVVDVNDNSPRFLEFPYVAHISPHAPLGSQVALVQAHDGDDGPNADVFYT
ncbi:hypothetical protein HPB49_002991 [Dermacentor silvarum]|uniref:Uncharacterized protein n=1 Tax=Dermacentor silvarum TaxID=543639 RepID=A0ACB8CV00_DERSI|nr:hypothetical protein HPB49_002991 [Dermacentor silvarum]